MVVILTLHGELQNDFACLCLFKNIYVAYITKLSKLTESKICQATTFFQHHWHSLFIRKAEHVRYEKNFRM